MESNKQTHALVIPLFGDIPQDFVSWVDSLLHEDFFVILVQNNYVVKNDFEQFLHALGIHKTELRVLYNNNLGGVAGGFNRGIECAIANNATWITLLDQDSRLAPYSLKYLLDPWSYVSGKLIVGPQVWDQNRNLIHHSNQVCKSNTFYQVRMLISSGSTFRADDWELLGPMNEWLVVDYVDHSWSFRASHSGFKLFQYSKVRLYQSFGSPHPNGLCSLLGMQLYTPIRHYYQLRNLRWLITLRQAPLDIRCKEFVKMLIKPLFWCLFEPNRKENLRSIITALRADIPHLTSWNKI